MSLMKTLAKVAVGVAVAKGASAMMRNSGGASSASAGGGLGGLLGSLAGGMGGGATPARQSGGLEDMLGGLLGGATSAGSNTGGMAGGLGGLLEQLGGASGGSTGAGLGDLLGGLAGAAGAGGLLGGLGSALGAKPAQNEHSFGAVLNSQFAATPEPEIEPSQDQEAAAGLMLAAMIQAAKSDGTFDDSEKDKLLGQLGDVDAQEAAFVQAQLQAPVDIEGLAREVPRGLEQQVYAMSVLGIDLDTQQEAQYLDKFARALGMKPAQVNEIHTQMGVPTLYS